ncbi:thioredoxin domain-containing protein 11-like isoform X2 [Stylophora pistillata]|uniref:thioredoxin domain-containing protein 11-like isoform X2 n=1 Tax=Stylophora pistillata TaxID=50429 RepID=UPI000C0470A3|nr:thioredoxin domain-containing protein 11-like isoform X2 [Stylophora pistillata]
MLFKYQFLLIHGISQLLLSRCSWFFDNGDANFLQPSKSRKFFSNTGKVIEISNGSMEAFKVLLRKDKITFVLFYAPWCGQSWIAAKEFNDTAEMLHREVSFIAINCWLGTCSLHQKIDLYPKLVAIHSHFHGVEYRGVLKAFKMVAFLQSVIRPFMYIGTKAELTWAKQSQELIIVYFNQTAIDSARYSIFFSLTLHFSAKESKPLFLVLTNGKLASDAEADNSGVSYHCHNKAVMKYPSNYNFSKENLTNWINANRCELVVQLTPTTATKKSLVHHLSKGPALILFLPLKLNMNTVNEHLQHTYIHAASQYFNGSCDVASRKVNSSSKHSKGAIRIYSTVVESIQLNVDQLTTRTMYQKGPLTVNSIDQGEFNVLRSLHQRIHWNCQSFKVKISDHPLQRKSFSICNLCHTRPERGLRIETNTFRLPFSVRDHILSSLSSFGYGCSSFRPPYFVRIVSSICCTPEMGESTKVLSYLRQGEFPQQETRTQMDDSVSGIFDELINSVTPKLKGSSIPNDNCGAMDPVSKFTGAGCTSNRSVNFFLVDSIEHWTVAERLGVSWTPEDKIALVIADFKNDVQFVLDKNLEITNSSIVEFIMAYMAGNLTRRLRSAHVTSHGCPQSQACVVEVVASNFNEVVLDETKDVFLLYYSPWCGYCQALGPVLLTVARFFKKLTGVTIARKDLSIRFPDSLERTSANIINFILNHGLKERSGAEKTSFSERVRSEIRELEKSLCQVEKDKQLLEIRVVEALRTKELRGNAQDRVATHLDQEYQGMEEKVHKLVKGSKKVLIDLWAAETKLNEKGKQLSGLSFEKRHYETENEELFKKINKENVALLKQSKVLGQLQKSLTALRRRATYLEISNNILRNKFRKSFSEARYPNY